MAADLNSPPSTPPPGTPAPGESASRASDTSVFAVAVPAVPTGIRTARHRLGSWLRDHSITGALLCDVVLLADEAVTNAVEHGHRHLDNGEVLITATVDTRRITVTVTDRGRWRPEQDNAGITHGWGIPMMHALADDIAITSGDSGTTLTAHFHRQG